MNKLRDLLSKSLVVGVVVLFFMTVIGQSSAYLLNDKLSLKPVLDGDIIYVDDDNTEGPWDGSREHPYQTIKKAIAKAVNGTTIFVFNGEYKEYIDIMYKSIKLIGEDKYKTIINGKGHFEVISIISENVTISNFTIKNGCRDMSTDWQVEIYASKNITISNNIIEKSKQGGMRLGSTSNSKILNNIIRNNANSGLIISHWTLGKYSTDNIISGNHFFRNNRGIHLAHSSTKNNLITKNNFIFNKEQADFQDARKNTWINNYWNRPKILPKIIKGILYYPPLFNPMGDWIGIRFFKVDWHPAMRPFEIGG